MAVPGFTSDTETIASDWFEDHENPTSAIASEEELKKWRRDLRRSVLILKDK